MSTNLETITDWFRDAYAMERGLEIALGKQAENKNLHPAVRGMAARHLTETRQHAEAVKTCLETLGAGTSMLKTGLAEAGETVKWMSTKFAQDERVKDLLATYAKEHFEIACYRAIETAAREIDEPQVAEVCRRIIRDEERMAAWIRDNLPSVVVSYIQNPDAVPA
ncbi:MAG: hypothetical protein JWM59_4590 [Verrucomicrobiales bacterium]|nr:hypothetical protein [Verrucomicrobiales bacterium]